MLLNALITTVSQENHCKKNSIAANFDLVTFSRMPKSELLAHNNNTSKKLTVMISSFSCDLKFLQNISKKKKSIHQIYQNINLTNNANNVLDLRLQITEIGLNEVFMSSNWKAFTRLIRTVLNKCCGC